MSSVAIYYVSSTGNSLAVARDVADRLDAKLVPMLSTEGQESVDVEADVIGLVFPIYDFKPAPIVERFVRKLENIDAKYLFAICTWGIAPAQSLKQVEKVVTSCGGRLSGGFAVGMPHSGIGSGLVSRAEQEAMFRNWPSKLEEIVHYVDNRAEGHVESSHLFLVLFQSRFVGMLSILFKFLKHALLHGVDSLAFTADGACNGCGICERICPFHNIEIVDGKPTWSDGCANCFACLNWCPKEAISLGGADMDIRNYHHPDVKIPDMLRQRQYAAKPNTIKTTVGDDGE